MKNRIAASLVLATALALGASGCSLIAHNGTTVHYSPSDGVEVTGNGVALRNMILVAAQDGENFNVVFTAVNTRDGAASIVIDLEADGRTATVKTSVPQGTTAFGDVGEHQTVLVASLPGLKAGASAKAYVTIEGQGGHEEYIPVLDGTLLEYTQYVLNLGQLSKLSAAADVKTTS